MDWKFSFRRYTWLLVIYAALIIETVVHFLQMRDLLAVRPEILLAVLIGAAYIALSRIFEQQWKFTMLNDLVSKSTSGMALVMPNDRLTVKEGNPAFFRIIGYAPQEFRSRFHNEYASLIDSDDLPAILEKIHQMREENAEVHVDYRMTNAKGEIQWLRMDITLQKISQKRCLSCTITDHTEVQLSREAGEMEIERNRILLHFSEDIFFSYDLREKALTVSRLFLKSKSEDVRIENCDFEYVGQHLVCKEDMGRVFRFWSQLEKKSGEKAKTELRIYREPGRYFWCRMEGIALCDRKGKINKVIGRIVDVDKQKRETEFLTQKSQREPMTGLLNKVVTEQTVEQYLREATSEDHAALMILDVDNFKSINDTFGHLTGDHFLTALAGELKKNLSSSEVIGRIGGDEFLIFMRDLKKPETPEQKAIRLCNAMRKSSTENLRYDASISIGIALFPEDGKTYKELFLKADKALYSVKGHGKNGYAFYREYESSAAFYARKDVSGSPVLHRHRVLDDFIDFMDEHCMDPDVTEQMLEIICRCYHARKSYVLEFSPDARYIRHVFAWADDASMADLQKTTSLPEQYWNDYLSRFDQNGIYQGDLPPDERETVSPEKAPSFVQHVQFCRGRPASILGFETEMSIKRMTFHEASTFSLIHKVLQYYLLIAETFSSTRSAVSMDILTGVLTYEAFHGRLKDTLEQRPFRPCALISCDINHFSEINDVVGHEQGDRMLVALTSAILRDLHSGEYIGRVSADIFTVLVAYKDRMKVQERIKNWEKTFQMWLQENHVSGTSIATGLYVIHPEEDLPATIFDRANAARKLGKNSRMSCIHFYDRGMHQHIQRQKELERHMTEGLEKKQFVVYFQPKCQLSDRKIAGAEALVRWQHPTLGLIPPSDFIPLFEKNHFVIELDFYVLDTVCRTIRKWMDGGQPVLPIAVNFSRVHLLTQNFVERLLAIVNSYQVPPRYLEIELTESAYITRADNMREVAQTLRKEGFLMAMDDFGAGYSSLNALRSLPFDVLKLDKNFFCEKEPGPQEVIIVENIVRLAKQLNLCVVSEGVELEWQAEFLDRIGCDLAQGYLFSRPIPIPDFEKMVKEQNDPKQSRQ